MYQISREKMPELLAAVAKEMDLFLPVQNNGITNFGFWTEDAKVDLDTLKTVKSPKDAFSRRVKFFTPAIRRQTRPASNRQH